MDVVENIFVTALGTPMEMKATPEVGTAANMCVVGRFLKSNARVEKVIRSEENRKLSSYEVELLDWIQDLELQVRMVRGENMDFRKVISQMYNFSFIVHNELKAQCISMAGNIEDMKETLESTYPRKKKKIKVTESEMEVISRKMGKLKKYMETAGNYVDLCNEQNSAANVVGAAMGASP